MPRNPPLTSIFLPGIRFGHKPVKMAYESNKLMIQLKGKIVLVDDDSYEKDLLESALKKRGWDAKVEYFDNAHDALDHLKQNTDEIFLIISDMNMPKMNGMDFKKTIDNDLGLAGKSIPFIFATSSSSKSEITEAFDYRVQGYFPKPGTTEEQADMLDIIIKYWIVSSHPNKDIDANATMQTIAKRTTPQVK
jgi:CheY-like chemotaxis protein